MNVIEWKMEIPVHFSLHFNQSYAMLMLYNSIFILWLQLMNFDNEKWKKILIVSGTNNDSILIDFHLQFEYGAP